MRKRMLQMLAVVILIIAILGFVKFRQIQGMIAAGKAQVQPPEAVTTAVAKPQHWQSTIDAMGTVAAVQGVMLSADQPGIVSRINFVSGARVQTGQVLVYLDTRQERAQLASAAAQRALAKLNLDRSKKLFDQQVIAQADFDQLEAQYKQADATADGFEAAIARKTIRAPFSGIAGIRQVNLGQYVNSGDPVVPVQQMDPVYVNFAVPQQQAAMLRSGIQMLATSDVSPSPFSGHITAVNPVVDDATRNVQVQGTFRNPRGLMRSGMYVTVKVQLGARNDVIALPASAINFAPYGNSVFIVEEMKGPDGKAYRGVRQQFVKLGTAQGDLVAILDGVKAGQEVVTSGVFKLRTGASVTVNNKVQPSSSPAPKPEDS